MQKSVSWSYTIFVCLISMLVGFFCLLFIEVPLGDIAKDILDPNNQLEPYFNINLIIYLGLIIVFGVSFFLNWLFFRDYLFKPKILSNISSLFLTGILLFAISGISVIMVYNEIYSQLDLANQIKASLNYFSIYSIYILPNPTWFWVLALLIYHSILAFFIKYFYVKKLKKRNYDYE